jgi:hypothetical protein
MKYMREAIRQQQEAASKFPPWNPFRDRRKHRLEVEMAAVSRKALVFGLVLASLLAGAQAHAQGPTYTPVTGAWFTTSPNGQSATLIFRMADSVVPPGIRSGSVFGSTANGRYLWTYNGPNAGWLSIVGPAGQFDVYVTFDGNGNRMTWHLGGNTPQVWVRSF